MEGFSFFGALSLLPPLCGFLGLGATVTFGGMCCSACYTLGQKIKDVEAGPVVGPKYRPQLFLPMVVIVRFGEIQAEFRMFVGACDVYRNDLAAPFLLKEWVHNLQQ